MITCLEGAERKGEEILKTFDQWIEDRQAEGQEPTVYRQD